MATIKAIEGRSVHQIQSGQVIVDLCSVVKELVENGLDAGASSLEVRFKANGLEAIEVQDNGSGIPLEDFETLALKHYTSKLSTYDDLNKLHTFGFRGEALSSVCALSNMTVVTAQGHEAPKGTKLEFETSGKLKTTSVAAMPKGTAVIVEGLFQKLPVRRRELEKNIKREYNKVIGILNAYACVCDGIKFSVTNQASKGKKSVVFSTKGNQNTRDNIANVYGAKTVSALMPLDLVLEMQVTKPTPVLLELHGESSLRDGKIEVHGHVSRPVHGEGRQTPDRQMFFVNSRPCALPQVAKAFNEIYKSYNVTQSPFIFANLIMDTNAYDVNVSPDKRTIMLHDQQHLLDTLKDALVALFESQEQTVPLAQNPSSLNTPFKRPSLVPQTSTLSDTGKSISQFTNRSLSSEEPERTPRRITTDDQAPVATTEDNEDDASANDQNELEKATAELARANVVSDPRARIVQDFNARIASQQAKRSVDQNDSIFVGQFEENAATDGESSPSEVDQHEQTESLEGRSGIITAAEASPIRPFRIPQMIKRSSSDNIDVHDSPDPEEENSRKRRRIQAPESLPASSVAVAKSANFTSRLRGFAAPGTENTSELQSLERDDVATVDEAEDEEQELDEESGPGAYTQVEEDTRNDPDWQKLAQDASSPPLSSDSDAEIEVEDESHNPKPETNQRDLNEDGEYVDDATHKAREEARIQKLVEEAEYGIVKPSKASMQRTKSIMNKSGDLVVNAYHVVPISLSQLEEKTSLARQACATVRRQLPRLEDDDALLSGITAEERLSLTISKSDFAKMRVAGQFNLGFVLAVRPSSNGDKQADDLFIIDQHASDEIFNFHRLSASTELTAQPLVQPQQLELTAIEEETVITHMKHSLLKNGFRIEFDDSGDSPVGQRCKLMTLPTSKETIFSTADLEELLVLLQDAPPPVDDIFDYRSGPLHTLTASSKTIVRPGKVRRMLAMRACRSSIMVGRALTQRQMASVVRHMGEMERPWNCPHGRPTMRHVCGLNTWKGWTETGPSPWAHQDDLDDSRPDWASYLA